MHPVKAWTVSFLLLLGGILFALIGASAHDASTYTFSYIMFWGAGLLIIAGVIFKFLVKCPSCEGLLWWRGLPKPYCGHCGKEV